MRLYRLLGGLSLILLVSAALGATSLNVPNGGSISASSARWFDYVVVIMLENHSINYTYGISNPSWTNSSSTCLGNCTFLTSIADQNALAEGYTNTGVTGGSIGDYIAITSGFGNTSSSCQGGPATTGCPLLQRPNIVDSLENAHLTWKAYMEGYPIASGCYNDFSSYPDYYAPNHNPFIYYSNIQNNAVRCSRIVRANSIDTQPNISPPRCGPIPVNNDDLFLNDLGSVADASNYMFLVPNTVDDNHDCNDVSVGNAWLQQMVPQILNSYLFRTQRAALFITYDEPDCTYIGSPTSIDCPPAAPQIYAVWASNPTSSKPTTLTSFKSTFPFTHFSQLKTVEDNWHLPYLIASTDGSPSTEDMQVFFV